MPTMTVGVVREGAAGEHRVALVPDGVAKLRSLKLEVLVEAGAGAAAWFDDDAYVAAGAAVVPHEKLYEHADVVVCVGPPEAVPPGKTLIGLLEPLTRPELVRAWAGGGVTAVSLDLLPRTLSRAQAMDALTSQASAAGYQAALVAAEAYGGYFPMLTTAAGTMRPASVLVLGAGVAGLQAIGTTRRLGAVVTAYDVRPEAREEVESLGARFADLPAVEGGSGTGGYAAELSADQRRAQQEALADLVGRSDVVITTARVPGGRPPVLVTGAALARMRPGSVVVDMGASELGGNVEGSAPGATSVAGGVSVIGAGDLASRMAPAASTAYSRNVTALLSHLTHEGVLTIDLDDEVQAAVVVTRGGSVVNSVVARRLDADSATGGTA